MIWQRGDFFLREQMAAQCAPLLAGLKPSNLLIVPEGFGTEIRAALRGTEVAACCLSDYGGKQVFLLYRVNELMVYLTETEVQSLLFDLGYEGGELFALVRRVSEKYTAHKKYKTEFPHELGLLLGYPAVDVRGFMEHNGKNFLYSGYWKVYGNVRETVSLFREFNRAKEWIAQLVSKGYSIADIAALYDKNKSCCLAVS